MPIIDRQLLRIKNVNQTCRDSFIENLDNVNWNNLNQTYNIDELTFNFIETIQQKFFECFSMIAINRKEKDIHKAYITVHIKRLIRKKNKPI